MRRRAAVFYSWACALGLSLVCPLPPARGAPPAPEPAERLEAEGIDRFARIDTGVYRGSTPNDEGLEALARAKVKTLVCLRPEVPYREAAEKLGLRIVHLPLSQFEAPSRESLVRFLDTVTDPAQQPVFFHCRLGRDRTGVMALVYRMQVQGWPRDLAWREMEDFDIAWYMFDLKGFAETFLGVPPAGSQAGGTGSEVRTRFEAAERALASGDRETALQQYEAALALDPDSVDARLGLARGHLAAGRASGALEEARRAMIRALSAEDRDRVARATIQILAEAAERGDLPAEWLHLAEREWGVLHSHGAEEPESLVRLGRLFEKGLFLSRALDAYEGARALGTAAAEDLAGKVERLRSVRSLAPRSGIGKRLGLMPAVSRAETAALLIQELRIDRLRSPQGSPTWHVLDAPAVPPPLPPDAEKNPHRADIERVLALGVRGLEILPDGSFHPDDPVRRAELVVILEDVLTRATRDPTLPTQRLGAASRFGDVKTGAWYQAAAELAHDLGLFAPREGEEPSFRPLDPVTGIEALEGLRMLKDRLDTRSRVLVLVIDALRAGSIYRPLDEGRLPRIERLARERGIVRFEEAFSALPSDTLPNHTTIFTGVYPGRHGVTGNEWFDRTLDERKTLRRRTREYIKVGEADDPGLGLEWSFGGTPVHATDMEGAVRTVYEAIEEAERRRGREARTVVVFDPVRRGADEVVNPDLFDAILSLDFLPFVDSFPGLDASSVDAAVDEIESDEPPDLMGIWLPGLDGWSHANGPGPADGPDDRQARYVAENLDPLIGQLVESLEERGMLDETALVLTSDHGQTDTPDMDEFAIEPRKVHGALKELPYRVPLDRDGDFDEDASEFDIVVEGGANGGAALVSVRTPGRDWLDPAERAEADRVARALLSEPYVNRIFFLESVGPSAPPRVLFYSRGEAQAGAMELDSRWDPTGRLAERIAGFFGSARSGDLLVEAKSPYYFAVEGKRYRGEHGRADGIEDHVPFVILNPPGGGRHAPRDPVGNVDVAPTVAGLLGFSDSLVTDGRDLLDPPRVRVSSHTEGQVVAAGEVEILGFAEDGLRVDRVEVRVGDSGEFAPAVGTSFWEARVVLPPGRHPILVRATDALGLQSSVVFHLEAR